MSAKTRLAKLEQAGPEPSPVIIVCWDENPKAPGPGVKVVSWPDDDLANTQKIADFRRYGVQK